MFSWRLLAGAVPVVVEVDVEDEPEPTTERARGIERLLAASGMLPRGDRLRRLADALAAGLTQRAIAASGAASQATATKARALLRQAGITVPCACGQSAQHKGMCSARWAVRRARG